MSNAGEGPAVRDPIFPTSLRGYGGTSARLNRKVFDMQKFRRFNGHMDREETIALQSILLFLGLTFVLSVAANWFVRRCWLAVIISAVASSVANIGHEIYLHNFQIRPVDAAFWIPVIFIQGVLFSLPVAVMVGVPFYLVRRRRRLNIV
jgi:hypothetical protein